MIYILYSTDYEVFLGGNYLPEEQVLIDPTEALIDACEEIGIPLNIFCDVACLWRYRELGYHRFPDAAEQQLRSSNARGHDVQAHIHPHWLVTEIKKIRGNRTLYKYDLNTFLLGRYDCDISCYKFSYEIFNRAREYLNTLLKPVNRDYNCMAYRAGGYGIQPKTSEILAALCDAGFLIDSSIVPGLVLKTNVNNIDFTDVPCKGNYWLKPETELRESKEGCLFEIPIAACRIPRLLIITSRISRILRKMGGFFIKEETRISPRGFSIQSVNSTPSLSKMIKSEIINIWNNCNTLELSTNVDLMITITKKYISNYYRDNNLYFSIISHSKVITPALLCSLKEYHRKLKDIYGSKIRAITFQEVMEKQYCLARNLDA